MLSKAKHSCLRKIAKGCLAKFLWNTILLKHRYVEISQLSRFIRDVSCSKILVMRPYLFACGTCVGERLLIARYANWLIIVRHVVLSPKGLIAVPAAKVLEVPVAIFSLRVFRSKYQLQQKTTAFYAMFRLNKTCAISLRLCEATHYRKTVQVDSEAHNKVMGPTGNSFITKLLTGSNPNR